MMGNGARGQINGPPPFDLDERYHIGFLGDDVDLANGRSVALCQYAISLEPQVKCRQVLAKNTAPVTGTALGFMFGLGAYLSDLYFLSNRDNPSS